MGLAKFVPIIAKVAEVAGKEYSIEQALVKMENDWEPISFEILPYKQTGTYIVRFTEDISQMIDVRAKSSPSISTIPFRFSLETT